MNEKELHTSFMFSLGKDWTSDVGEVFGVSRSENCKPHQRKYPQARDNLNYILLSDFLQARIEPHMQVTCLETQAQRTRTKVTEDAWTPSELKMLVNEREAHLYQH